MTAPAQAEQLAACRRARLNSPVRLVSPPPAALGSPAMRRNRVRVRTCRLNVLRGLTLATLMTLSARPETRAGAADPSADTVPKSAAQGSVSTQPAGARKPPQAASQPASRTQATQPLARRKDGPAPAAHDPPPVGQHVEARDAPTRSQSSSSSAPARGPPSATAPPQPARQAPGPTPPAARPPDAHPPEHGPQPQTKDPDVRDSGPHADRTSRDRAER